MRDRFEIHFLFFLLSLTLAPIADAQTSRPNADKGPTEIKVAAIILDIDEINDAEQVFAANILYQARWSDPRLAHSGSDLVRLPLSKVWHPDIQILNQQRLQFTLPNEVSVDPNGEVHYRQRVWGKFSQPLKLHDFPLDEQTLSIQILSSSFPPTKVQLNQDPLASSRAMPEFSLTDWQTLGWESGSELLQIAPEFPGRSTFFMNIRTKRLFGYYILKVITPLCLIVAMSWIVFWINPEQAGTQIGVAATSMLTLIAYRFSVDTVLPRISYLTRMDIFVLLSSILVFATLVEASYTAVLSSNDENARALKIDRYCRIFFPLMFVAVGFYSFSLF